MTPLLLASGRVIESSWPVGKAKPTLDLQKIRCCIEHWVNSTSWEDTGIYDLMEDLIEKHGVADGCRNLTDIVRRYDRLDLIFERAKQEGRLRTMEEVNPGCFREEGGVLIHVGPEGELFFGGLGAHRFAIARILKLPLPAMIGCVHVSAIPYLTQLRQEIEDQSGFISGEL